MTSWASEPEEGPWAVRSARISLRLQPAALEALRAAAELRAQDLTSFVLGAALDRAADVVGRERNSRLQLALIAEDPARYRRDPRIPDDPDLVAMVAEALLARDRRHPGDVPTVDPTPRRTATAPRDRDVDPAAR
ncbi:DUF1778 domain-containing protein [Cellulomonas sp. NTE-D12]|uniref:type II toxin -antitoxin system TacA 1-like antitoxin n=1 Tax=Cellulomonas sp. NTE-D12 TaxID=2962632 RepID=UPI003081477B|nr:hypothetical protein CELD12_30040 [Cellulomonas sp. NTE-D12]